MIKVGISFVFIDTSKFSKIIFLYKVRGHFSSLCFGLACDHLSEMQLLVYMYIHMGIWAVGINTSRKEILSYKDL